VRSNFAICAVLARRAQRLASPTTLTYQSNLLRLRGIETRPVTVNRNHRIAQIPLESRDSPYPGINPNRSPENANRANLVPMIMTQVRGQFESSAKGRRAPLQSWLWSSVDRIHYMMKCAPNIPRIDSRLHLPILRSMP